MSKLKPDEALEILEQVLEVVGKLPKEVVMPKFVEKIFPNYKLVPKEFFYDVPIPRQVDKPYDVKIPNPVLMDKEVLVDKIKLIEKEQIINAPKLKYFDVETVSEAELNRIRILTTQLLPQIILQLEKIVKWIPKEESYIVPVPELKKVPYEIKEPVLVKVNVADPQFRKVDLISPIILEKAMTLEEWQKEAQNNSKKIDEINKSQETFKRSK